MENWQYGPTVPNNGGGVIFDSNGKVEIKPEEVYYIPSDINCCYKVNEKTLVYYRFDGDYKDSGPYNFNLIKGNVFDNIPFSSDSVCSLSLDVQNIPTNHLSYLYNNMTQVMTGFTTVSFWIKFNDPYIEVPDLYPFEIFRLTSSFPHPFYGGLCYMFVYLSVAHPDVLYSRTSVNGYRNISNDKGWNNIVIVVEDVYPLTTNFYFNGNLFIHNTSFYYLTTPFTDTLTICKGLSYNHYNNWPFKMDDFVIENDHWDINKIWSMYLCGNPYTGDRTIDGYVDGTEDAIFNIVDIDDWHNSHVFTAVGKFVNRIEWVIFDTSIRVSEIDRTPYTIRYQIQNVYSGLSLTVKCYDIDGNSVTVKGICV